MSVAPTPIVPARVGLRWSLALFASAAAAAVYLNALHNPFIYDDHRLIVENDSLSALPNLLAIAVHEITRPLVNLTYAIDWSIWGLDPFGFHLTNVLLHMVNVALVFLLAGRLTVDAARPSADPGAPAANLVAAATALVFAVNPMMTQAVGYISGRSELLCALFVLLACLAVRQFIITSRVVWAFTSVGVWLLAMLSKEVAAVVPIVLILYDRWLAPPSAFPFRKRLAWLYAPMGVVTVAAVAVRLWVLERVEYPSDTFEPTFVLVQLEAIRRYAMLLFGQGPQSIFHQVDPYTDWLSARALFTIGTVPIAMLCVWTLYRLHRLAAFGTVWFLLFLVPSSTLFILGRGEAMAEHRTYVAGIGFFLAIGALVERGAQVYLRRGAWTRRLAVLAACVVVAQLAMHTVLRNAAWSSPVGLWQDAVARASGHWLPRLMLGEAFRESGQCANAVPEYRLAVAGNPDEPMAYAHLGGCLIAINRLDEASRVFTAMNEHYPESAEAAAGLGLVAVAEGRLDEGQGLLRESLRRDGASVPVQQLLVALEGRGDDLSQATAFCEQVRAIAPSSRTAVDCARGSEGARP